MLKTMRRSRRGGGKTEEKAEGEEGAKLQARESGRRAKG